MSMYLSNRDLRPTGYEPAEFVEPPPFAPAAERSPGTPEDGDEDDATSEP